MFPPCARRLLLASMTALATEPHAAAYTYLIALDVQVEENGKTFYGIKTGHSRDIPGKRERKGEIPRALCVFIWVAHAVRMRTARVCLDCA
jgi:hypothetical protein